MMCHNGLSINLHTAPHNGSVLFSATIRAHHFAKFHVQLYHLAEHENTALLVLAPGHNSIFLGINCIAMTLYTS